ncbi:MAG: dockerin type I repeat-containing protein [Clostridia bacterium]|nr:dockerin type I repeat-containing protein [Clostridia bacterium]
MKKMICMFLALVLTASCALLPAGFAFAAGEAASGDVDGDGHVSAIDARLALRRSVGLETYAEGSREFLACDVDADGQVGADDARIILRRSVGLDLPQTDVEPQKLVEIMDLYKKAVGKVKNGEAGYDKKAWQTLGDVNITGIAVADNIIKEEVARRMTPEEMAETRTCAKGSQQAIDLMPACTLTDYSKVRAATCDVVDGNYKIRIIMQDEDTPKDKNSSFLAQVTDNILLKNDIDKELQDISIIKDSDYRVIYEGFVIEATVTPDGRFVQMRHFASAHVIINSAKILIVSISGKEAGMASEVLYDNFIY